MERVAEGLIAVNHDRGGRTYYIKVNASTLGERIAYVQSIDLGKTRLQLAQDAGLCERTVIRLEKGEVTRPLLFNTLAIAEALGVSLDWLCARIDETGDNINETSAD